MYSKANPGNSQLSLKMARLAVSTTLEIFYKMPDCRRPSYKSPICVEKKHRERARR